jgi:hypothetical protein
MFQSQAQTYCLALSWGGYASGWRLPTIDELRSLIRGCTDTLPGGACGVTASGSCLNFTGCWSSACADCTLYAGPGPGGAYWPPQVTGNPNWVWSSSAVTDHSGYFWGVNFDGGSVTDYQNSVSYAFVRCVRNAS